MLAPASMVGWPAQAEAAETCWEAGIGGRAAAVAVEARTAIDEHRVIPAGAEEGASAEAWAQWPE